MATEWTTTDMASVQAILMPKNGRRDRVRLPESPRGSLSSGLTDFRGFPLHVVNSVEINDADFSRARSPNNEHGVEQAISLISVKCSRVVFDHARVFHLISGEFAGCSFKKIGTSRCGIAGTFRTVISVELAFVTLILRPTSLGADFTTAT